MDNKTIYKGPIFDLVQTELILNGKPCERDVIVHPGGAAILAIHEGKVLLVRQKRAGSGEPMIEIPAGMIDPGEDPAITAARELNEETGWSAAKMDLLCAFYPTPGYDSEKIYVYRAVDLQKAEHRLAMDADEEIERFWFDLNEAKAMVKDGRIMDAKTIIALLMA